MQVIMLSLCLCAMLLVSAHGLKNSADPKQVDLQELSTKVASMAEDLARTMNKLDEISGMKGEKKMKVGDSMLPIPPIKNDSSLEERVAVLESQMTTVNEEITLITGEIEDLDQQVDIAETEIVLIKSDQVLQDQRLLELEDDTEIIEVDIQALENSISSLHTTDASFNTSITSLEEDVAGLQETDEEHSTDITELMSTVESLSGSVNDLDTRLSKLELDGSIAFHAWLGLYSSIPIDTVVVFDRVNVDLGNGYNSATGQFTVPSGGAGLYYFYAHFTYDFGQYAQMAIRVNGQALCRATEDDVPDSESYAGSSCGAVVTLEEGDVVDVYYDTADSGDDFPLVSSSISDSGFTGFRIAPQ